MHPPASLNQRLEERDLVDRHLGQLLHVHHGGVLGGHGGAPPKRNRTQVQSTTGTVHSSFEHPLQHRANGALECTNVAEILRLDDFR